MRKCAFITIFLISTIATSSQKILPDWDEQAGDIDSLISRLPAAHDTARINLLNELSFAYCQINKDSATQYATTAFNEASATKYWKGISISLFYQGQIKITSGNYLEAKKFTLHALAFSKRCKEQKISTILSIALAYQLANLKENEDALKLLEIAESDCNRNNNETLLAQVYHVRSMIYGATKRTYDSFKMSMLAARLFKKTQGHSGYARELTIIARIYGGVGEYATAISYYNQCNDYLIQHHLVPYWRNYFDIGHLYLLQKRYASALYFCDLALSTVTLGIKDSVQRIKTIMQPLIGKAEIYLAAGDPGNALKILLPALEYFRKEKDNSNIVRTLRSIGKAHIHRHEYAQAIENAKKSVQIASNENFSRGIKDGAALLSIVYDKLGRPDSAWHYYKLSDPQKDSTTAIIQNNNLTFFKAMKQNEADEVKIEMLKRDNQIKQQRLNVVIASMLLLIVVVFFSFRYNTLKRKNESQRHALLKNEMKLQQLESEKKQVQLQKQATDLEMQALRAQMNPHFIFNCLSAINSFVLKNETETASDYLTKFSRLIRSVLRNSLKTCIPLSDEIATLQLYIELEQVRFKDHFRYVIFIGDSVDLDGWMIPPLLLQPFVENAIWHGLMHREEEGGNLAIEIDYENGMLVCTITDNGIGRHQAAEDNTNASQKESLGIKITSNRLKMLNPGKHINTFFTIVDLKDGDGKASGTKIIIKMPAASMELSDN